MRRILLTILLLAACAPIAACGDSDDGGTGSVGTTDGGRAVPGNDGTRATIVMQDIAYSPPLMIVILGTEITWVNNDSVQHDVESTSGEKVDSELFGKGESFSFTPTRTGAIEYVCTVHPGMKARIQIEPKA